jgi:hypothetical protein
MLCDDVVEILGTTGTRATERSPDSKANRHFIYRRPPRSHHEHELPEYQCLGERQAHFLNASFAFSPACFKSAFVCLRCP